MIVEVYLDKFVFTQNNYQGKVLCSLRQKMLEKQLPDYVEQPFLGYSNSPTPVNNDSTFAVNSLGLKRLEKTTLKKADSTYRILFLGGPSTWGMVNNLKDTYPMILEKLLNEKRDSPVNHQYKKYECLNAGLRGAASADLLVQYLFKFQYLEPDLIVIHAGFNDAFTYLCQAYQVQYQPDYHTVKRIYQEPNYDFGMFRHLFVSKAISYMAIKIFYHDFITSAPPYNPFFQFRNYNLWFEAGNDSIFSTHYNALYNNVRNLVAVASSKNQKVLLVPEFYYKYDPLFGKENQQMFEQGIAMNDSFFRKISVEMKVPLCTLPIQNFSAEMFLPNEDRYVNEKGEAMKAKLILPYVEKIIASTYLP